MGDFPEKEPHQNRLGRFSQEYGMAMSDQLFPQEEQRRGLWGKGPPAPPRAQERPLLNAPGLRNTAKPGKQKGATKAC